MRYRNIEAWGRSKGWQPEQVQRVKELARREAAPEQAIYRKADGKWVLLNETRPEVQAALEEAAA